MEVHEHAGLLAEEIEAARRMGEEEGEQKGEKTGDRKEGKKGDENGQTRIKKGRLKHLFRGCSKSDYFLLSIGIFFNGLQGAVMPIFLILFGDIMDASAKAMPSLNDLVLKMVYLAICSFFFCTIGLGAIEVFSERHTTRLKLSFFRAVLRQEIGWFDSVESGGIGATMHSAVVAVRTATGKKLGQATMFLTMSIGGIIVALYTHAIMALVMLGISPILIIACALLAFSVVSERKATEKSYQAAGDVAEEGLTSIRTITSLNAQEHFKEKYTSHLAVAQREGFRGSVRSGSCLGLLFGSMFLMYSLGFWYGGELLIESLHEIAKGGDATMSGGRVLTVFFGVLFGGFSLGQLVPILTDIFKGMGGASELWAVIDRVSKIDPFSPLGQIPTNPPKGDIKFENVSFRYPSRPAVTVFNQFNLHIQPGQTVALIGESGCGKSTITQLLERFYDPEGGQILIDGIPLKSLKLLWWRRQLGFVTQEPRLFSMTVRENIKAEYGGSSDLGDVMAAAKTANAHDFISNMSEGYETVLGDGGGGLSGGQKQRVAIARAMYRTPSVLILDEATSALDTESERIVQEAISNLLASRAQKQTTVIIAHRLSTVRHCDRIVVLGRTSNASGANQSPQNSEKITKNSEKITKNSEKITKNSEKITKNSEKITPNAERTIVLEEGSHDELMAKQGEYFRMVNMQEANLEHVQEEQQHTQIHPKPSLHSIDHRLSDASHTHQLSLTKSLSNIITKKKKKN